MKGKRYNGLCGSGIFLLVAALFILSACDGSSSSKGSGGRAELSEARIVSSLETIEENVPGCIVADTSMAMAPVSLMKAAVESDSALSGIRNLSAFLLNEIQGDCGGTLSIDSVHKSGNTTFTVVFNNFCFYDDEGITPQEVVINGTLKGVEQGTPGNFGPTISGFNANSEGKVTMQTADETITVSLTDLQVKYGVPGTWEPGTPTAANPDRLTIKQVSVDLKNQGISHTLKNLDAKMHESGDNKIVEIRDGIYNTGSGYVSIYTSQPLVVDDWGNMAAGTIVLEGDGDVVEISRAPGTPFGVLEVKRNGVKIDKRLDCSGVDISVLDILSF